MKSETIFIKGSKHVIYRLSESQNICNFVPPYVIQTNSLIDIIHSIGTPFFANHHGLQLRVIMDQIFEDPI